ncbi:Plant protein of unknown function (DUF868 [Striga hermonthica]|uniref:Uncharacterized protein n=1 Tax=Striga hermonthica TaxID=68872 RepID=A0A9N7NCX7_STRHE|nr:Plant protein of unknown function (DUF868 [Striga hermonthica]
MRDLASCFSEHAVQVSDASCSGAGAAETLSPSAPTAVVCSYRLSLSSQKQILVSLAWCRSPLSQGLTLTFDGDHAAALKLTTHSRLFRKLKGARSIDLHGFAIEVHWDLSAARYEAGPEPIDGFYAASRKLRPGARPAEWCLVSRQEHFTGGSVYAARTRFREAGPAHEVRIQCGGEGEGEGAKQPGLTVWIDRKAVMRVKRLRWNFRGNQTIFVDGLLVDLMWDVHGWFNGSGSSHAVFMFRTRSGLDSRLWLEEKMVNGDREKLDFSLLICATKAM